jgi:hypothetical protein
VGSAATIENVNCRLDASRSSVSAIGNTLSLTVALSFNAQFTSGRMPKKNVCISATDAVELFSEWSCVGIAYAAPIAGNLVNRYRVHIPPTRDHLFTTDKNEYDYLGTLGFEREGIAERIYDGPATVSGVTAVPLYRIYLQKGQQHFWTIDRGEYLWLIQFRGTYLGEGVDGFVFPTQIPGTVRQYRVLHPLAYPPIHHWTTDQNEFDWLKKVGWIPETNNVWVFPPPPQASGAAAPPAYSAPDGPRLLTNSPLRKGRAMAANQDGSANGEDAAAPAGSTVTLYLENADENGDVQVWIGGKPAAARMKAGRLQVEIPEGLEPGAAPVTVRLREGETQPGVLVNVQ